MGGVDFKELWMPRRRPPTPDTFVWYLTPKDPTAIADARIALVLIRTVRRFRGLLERRSADDVGEALAPVLAQLPKELASAMSARRQELLARKDGERLDEEAFEKPLVDRTGLQYLGEGLSHQQPAFRELFDRAEALLVRFISRNPHPLDRNVAILKEVLSLTSDEAEFVRFAAAFAYGTIGRPVFDFVGGRPKILRAVPVLLGNPAISADRLVDRDGALATSGLFENIRSLSTCDLADLLALTPLGDRLLGVPFKNAAEMARAVLQPVAKASSQFSWPHLRTQQDLVEAALRSSIERGDVGINILLHGGPGTGKTEFARQIIERIGASGFAVADQDDKGREATRSERLTSLMLSQLFAGDDERAVLVLDEAEDIFQTEYSPLFGRPQRERTETKAWMNRLLETNRHPVIWISNRVEHLDPAYLRRFTFCLEFPRTPRAVRKRIASEYLAPVGCSQPVIDAVAAREPASPGLVASAARFAVLTQASHAADTAVINALDQHLAASGHTTPSALPQRATRFDMRYLNIRGSTSAETVAAALETLKCGTALFAGPPGTGKTQLAAEIATRLGRELVYRTASDINSMWFGQSERNVASLFRECDPNSEVLFLDEAEILLGSRSDPENRATVAVTAEFLRWLEAFQGVFLCATNHAKAFDAALARRFVFRLEFMPLTAPQRRELLIETAGVETLTNAVTAALDRMEGLTPGDFANVVKRFRAVKAKPPLTEWVSELELELLAKPAASQPKLGFI